MPVRSIASIWYPVSDWARALRFYTEALGLRLEASDDAAGWAAFRTPSGGPPIFLIRTENTAGAKSGSVVSFDADDIAELMARVVECGGSVSSDVQQGADSRIFTIYDPDGNTIEICEAAGPSASG
jgi:predicted enzyme related to lactoylglutathione lyase